MSHVVGQLPDVSVVDLRRMYQQGRVRSRHTDWSPFRALAVPVVGREVAQRTIRHALVRATKRRIAERNMPAET